MKIVKPLSLGVLFRPYTHRRRHRLAVTALGFFPLGGAGGSFLPENVQWPKVMAALPPGELLDAAMPKARGEVLLAGQAYAPAGKPVTEMEVRLMLGAVDKRLLVIGDRTWSYGLMPLHQVSAPEPFTAMPLTYARAYGGPAFADNPTGQGYTGERLGAFLGQNEGRMPNVEYAGEPVGSHCGGYAPAGFGPLDLRWRQRRSKAGTYDARWVAESYPGLADDIDFAVFNAAPEDQQFARFFSGGERYRLEGLHRGHRIVEGEVPALRVRAFAQRAGSPPEQAEEVAMVMDTLWLLPEADLGVAIHRGTAEASDSDAADFAALLLGYEDAAQPRAADHYRLVFALRLDPETAPAHAFNESQLTPVKSRAEQERLEAEEAAAAAQEGAATAGRVQAVVEEFCARAGQDAAAVAAAPAPSLLGPVPVAALRRGDVDLGPLLDRARAVAAQAQADGEARLTAARKRIEALPGRVPTDPEALKAEAERRARSPAGAVPDLPPLDDVEPIRREACAKAYAGLPKLSHAVRRVAPEPQSAPVPAFIAEHLGSCVRGWLRAGESLAGRDLTGAALAGVDLQGADLRGAILERADLSGACLRGADLREAVLTAAVLRAADLEGADLREANLSKVDGRGARFTRARLAQAMAVEADFSAAWFAGGELVRLIALRACFADAMLEQADLTDALFPEVHAERARLKGARLLRTMLFGAHLAGADLSEVTAERCVFTAVKAQASRWCGARLRDSHLGQRACFTGADLRRLDATGCGWRGADLRNADLREGVLAECDLGECRFDGARLEGALLARAVLAGASLRGCDGRRLDLFQALCRKSDFTGADLREANLYGATLMEAVLEKANLGGARHSRQREVA